MTLDDAIAYCYKHEKEFKRDCYDSGENGERQFSCLIAILEDGTITPDQLSEYGMDY